MHWEQGILMSMSKYINNTQRGERKRKGKKDYNKCEDLLVLFSLNIEKTDTAD